MRDGIIKADGTSRLLRADLPATYEELRTKAAAGEQPLDMLFNSAGWSQQPTFLNKANLLQDTTAALFGLGSGAVPDEVLAEVGKYNEYWWHGRKITRKKSETEISVDEDNCSSYYAMKSMSSSTGNKYNVYYSDEISIDEHGFVSLVNASYVSFSCTSSSGASSLKGHYIYPTYSGDAVKYKVYYIPDDAEKVTSSSYYCVYFTKIIVIGTTAEVEEKYVSDVSENFDPNIDMSDGYTYISIGSPFKNTMNLMEIESGSIVSTGARGDNIPLSFVPDLMIIESSYTRSSDGVTERGLAIVMPNVSFKLNSNTSYPISNIDIAIDVNSVIFGKTSGSNPYSKGTILKYIAFGKR